MYKLRCSSPPPPPLVMGCPAPAAPHFRISEGPTLGPHDPENKGATVRLAGPLIILPSASRTHRKLQRPHYLRRSCGRSPFFSGSVQVPEVGSQTYENRSARESLPNIHIIYSARTPGLKPGSQPPPPHTAGRGHEASTPPSSCRRLDTHMLQFQTIIGFPSGGESLTIGKQTKTHQQQSAPLLRPICSHLPGSVTKWRLCLLLKRSSTAAHYHSVNRGGR